MVAGARRLRLLLAGTAVAALALVAVRSVRTVGRPGLGLRGTLPQVQRSGSMSGSSAAEASRHYWLGSFGGRPLSRETGPEHKDPAWLAVAVADDAPSRFMVFANLVEASGSGRPKSKLGPILERKAAGGPVTIAWQTAAACRDAGADPARVSVGETGPIFLGERDGVQHFALLSGSQSEEHLLTSCRPSSEEANLFLASDIRSLLASCDQGDLSIVGQAIAKIKWHQTVLFCGSCGQRTESIEAGLKRACKSCGARQYPRTNPCCIVLVRHPQDPNLVLLGRGKHMMPGFYSCLAGFLEITESMEQAIAREVAEEAGIQVDISKGVDIIGTQPWPIGRHGGCDLMMGAEVVALTDKVTIDADEMDDVRWFKRDEVVEMLQTPVGTPGKLCVPGEFAIAHHLMQRWVKRTAGRL